MQKVNLSRKLQYWNMAKYTAVCLQRIRLGSRLLEQWERVCGQSGAFAYVYGGFWDKQEAKLGCCPPKRLELLGPLDICIRTYPRVVVWVCVTRYLFRLTLHCSLDNHTVILGWFDSGNTNVYGEYTHKYKFFHEIRVVFPNLCIWRLRNW